MKLLIGKIILRFVLLGSLALKAQDIQYATIVQTESFTIASNQTAMVISCICNGESIGLTFVKASNGNSCVTYISPTDSAAYFTSGNTFLFSRPSLTAPLIFTGPGTLTLTPNPTGAIGLTGGSSQGSIGIKVTTTAIASPGTVLGAGLPSTAVVIPSQQSGPVNIILESSTDLVNWTPASPGTFGGGVSTNRFFRVRAQAQ